MYNILESLDKLKAVYQTYSKSTQRHLFARENEERSFFFVTALQAGTNLLVPVKRVQLLNWKAVTPMLFT